MKIGTYQSSAAIYCPYDARVAQVAQQLIDFIQHQDPRIEADHIGSTAVPGCSGKGVIDLAVTYLDGDLEIAKAALDALGFQRQGGREPWPESRPMRIGSIGEYKIHAHVIVRNGPEHRELLGFRDALCSNPELLAAYEAQKRRILESGITDSIDYSKAKHDFISSTIARLAKTIE